MDENAEKNVVDMKRCTGISFSTIEEYDTIVIVILHALFAAVLLCLRPRVLRII